ncbi:L-asparaginase 1 [Deltaproteobacteria bacterium]|nr:L-asparaginase 1 [Deltaproteobacteria bacterium]
MKPRIRILSTGGTLAMLQRDPGPLAPSAIADNVLKYVQGLEAEVDLTAEALWNLDSSDMGPNHWSALADAVASRLADVDGLVVVHGTDTMAWSASALSFALRGLPKPVVLTGAQRPIAWVRTDARNNVVHSALCAGMKIPEVTVFFGRWLFRGNRVSKTSIQSYEAFESPDCPPILEMGVEVQAMEPPRPVREPFSVDARFDARVAILPVVPGSDGEALDALVDRGVRGVVVQGFGSGNVPQRGWPGAIRRATDAGVAVVMHSQCLRGHVVLNAYEGGRAAAEHGAIGSGAMTLECATVKLMHMLGRGLSGTALAEVYSTDLAGEGA